MGYEVSIKAAKDRLSELGRMVDAGEQVIITKYGIPTYELKAIKRKGGIDFEAIKRWKIENGGPIVRYVAPDFDDPLPDDIWSHND
ncbi:MAG: type II toxin-antitoxin system Phd/YefM family antitoxin [Sphingomonadaceae bacterium]